MSLARVVDLTMILRRLQSIGYTEEAANSIYGGYSTLAVSMFNLPASMVTPIALAVVPMLASSINCGDIAKERKTLNSAFKLCGLMIIPASFGLSAFSRPILELVFGDETGAVNIAAPLLSVLAVAVLFSCLMTVSNAVLQAYGKERKPIVSMLFGAAVKLILAYFLIGNPQINIYGAPLSTLACDITVTAINFAYIRKTTPCMEKPTDLFGRSLISAIIAVGGCAVAYYTTLTLGVLTPSRIVTVCVILVSGVIYLAVALKLGAIDYDDIALLPRGKEAYGIMKRIRLVK